MLPRVAPRAWKPSLLHNSTCNATPIASSIRLRTYARDNKPPRQPPPPQSSRTRAPPPPPKQFQPASASGAARQTSPGTALPRDQTWKPKDSIKFGGPTAAAATAQEAASIRQGSQGKPQEPLAQQQNIDEPVRGSVREKAQRMEAAAENTPAPHERETPRVETVSNTSSQDPNVGASSTIHAPPPTGQAAQQPLAQKGETLDEPVEGSIRDTAHAAQAASENTPPPPEAPEAQSQPLPDLRQGIPSTFDFEFGGKKAAGWPEAAETVKEDGVELTSSSGSGEPPREYPSGARDRGEQGDYDRSAYETSVDRRRAKLANYGFAAFLIASLTGCVYFARPYSTTEEVPAGLEPADASDWGPSAMWNRVRSRIGSQMGYYTEPTFPKLLPDVPADQRNPYTLVLSLEDLLVNSSWSREHGWRTAKRPGLDYFIRYLSQYYELVLFTSVPLAVADPVIKKMDPFHFIMWPLGREATKYAKGEYVKDLAYLNRPLSKTIMIDTRAPHAKNQPENAIIIPKWSGDPKDPHTKDLVGLIPFLEYIATTGTEDTRKALESFQGKDIPTEFARREGIAREKFNAQLAEERKKAPKRSLGALFGSGLGIKADKTGSMMLEDGSTVAEGLAQGKMFSDLMRERGQKQYELLEKQIRENGAQWLAEEEAEQKKMMEAQMKDMKKSAFNWFGGPAKPSA